jgi:adenylate cyclase
MERRLSAIFAADMVGYSRLMEVDEIGTLQRQKIHRDELINPALEKFHGRIVKEMGDGILVEFPSVVGAVQCAVDIQRGMIDREVEVYDDLRIQYRIGINLGDIIIEEDDIFGSGVNIAARLEQLAEPGGICISAIVHESLGNRTDIKFCDAGEVSLKNIERPARVFHWPANVENVQLNNVPELPDKPSIVVLPFDNLSSDPNQEYFADGMVEAITAALANIRSFFVIARNTAFTYKGKSIDIKTIGNELGVGYALEGSVQRAGNRIRITAQLVETENGAHVWAKSFDGVLDDVFELQDQLTEQVAGALQPSIQLAEIERVRRKRPQDLGAYDNTLQALPHVWSLEGEEKVLALSFLDRALKIDPEYPFALSLSALCHAQRALYNWVDDVEDSKSQALKLAEKAAEKSSGDPLVLSVLGTVHTILPNLARARILLERAVSINPNAAWTWSRLGWLESIAEQLEPALEYFKKAQRLDPFDPQGFNTYVGIGSAYEGAGEYDKAVDYYKRALQERPHAYWINRSLASVLAGAGRMEEAQEAFGILMHHYPGLTLKDIRQAMTFSAQFMDKMLDNLATLGMPNE